MKREGNLDFIDIDIELSEEDIKINNEKGDNLTEKRFSKIMVDAMRRRFFEKEIFVDTENGSDITTLGKKYAIDFHCIGDRTRGIRSAYLTPTYVLFVYKRYKNEKGHGALEIWKTYWFNIRHIDFRLSENYNENMVNNPEWFARLRSKEIYQYATIKELENVLQNVRRELFS